MLKKIKKGLSNFFEDDESSEGNDEVSLKTLVIVFVIGLVIIGGLYFFSSKQDYNEPDNTIDFNSDEIFDLEGVQNQNILIINEINLENKSCIDYDFIIEKSVRNIYAVETGFQGGTIINNDTFLQIGAERFNEVYASELFLQNIPLNREFNFIVIKYLIQESNALIELITGQEGKISGFSGTMVYSNKELQTKIFNIPYKIMVDAENSASKSLSIQFHSKKYFNILIDHISLCE